jgi:arylsulfatase A
MPTTRPPNIVLLLADDLGYGDLSALNPASRIHTPHHDLLARDGMVFTDAHSASSVCTPSRYAVLTGRYCWRSRLKSGVLWGYSLPLIEAQRPTLPGVLWAHGWRTWFVGKWHLGLGWQAKDGHQLAGDAHAVPEEAVDHAAPLTAGPHTLGFARSLCIPASLDMPPYCYIQDGRAVEPATQRCADSAAPRFWRGGAIAPSFRHESCLLELTQRCVSLIEAQGRATAEAADAAPFFLCFSMTSPHYPHCPRPPFVGKTPVGPYGDLVVEHDWSVGQVLAALERAGLARDTLVIATSDNCAQLFGQDACGHQSNHHFRGQKTDAWDGGHRVPLIARWPAAIRAGSSCDALVCLSDLFATVLGLAGIPMPAGAAPDSLDAGPLLRGAGGGMRASAIQHSGMGYFAVRHGQWKLVLCKGSGGWSQPEDQAPADAPPAQLYDMGADVGERRNQWHDQPAIARQLAGILAQEQARPV